MSESKDLRARLEHLLHHLEHVLPAQAPIRDFVHHNTLHGFQHLPFREALTAAEAATGAQGFLPVEVSRQYFRQGRIDLSDLNAALDETPELEADKEVMHGITRREVLRLGLLHDFSVPPAPAWAWRVEELGMLERIDAAVPSQVRGRLLGGAGEGETLASLWAVCRKLHAAQAAVAGAARDCVERTAESIPGEVEGEVGALWQVHLLHKEAETLLTDLLDRVGRGLTLGGLLLRLTGRDMLEDIRPYLVRHLASHLDQGLAAWHNPGREQGLYAAWRASAAADPVFALNDLDAWQQVLERLPADPVEAIRHALEDLGLEESRWEAYLENLAKELPGWSGMVLWRNDHPGYAGLATPIAMVDYLAVRLILEQVHGQRLCGLHFKTEASVAGLRGYLRHHPAELLVRFALYNENPPEWLADQGHRLVREATGRREEELDGDWQPVARLMAAWRASGGEAEDAIPGRGAWPLFLLAQHLGLNAARLETLGGEGAGALLACLADLSPECMGWVWLLAYERHYREQVFSALAANHGRGPWRDRPTAAVQPRAQLVFCMDDREEGFRRHLEEYNPDIETLGAAAHFSVFIRYSGLGDAQPTDLCPVVARPAHTIQEEPAADAEAASQSFLANRALRLKWKGRLLQGSRRDPAQGMLASVAGAPAALVNLAGKMLAPGALGNWFDEMRTLMEGRVPTRLRFTALEDTPASPETPRAGFTDKEQADRVQGFLRGIGLTCGFAPLVVIVGHGSNSLNNPHMSAYDCGACSGRHSGPNARLFAGMANRPQVRALLAERGIHIPAGTWFMGSEHNTCDDLVTWYDTESLPSTHVKSFNDLDTAMKHAGALHAQERSRRFMSASLAMDPQAAHRHVIGRRFDYSQARPELGHATNASAFIGRRAATRGAFFDRRIFLISYDCTLDPDGQALEPSLLANGPVGAGISLEYYFSTVDNQRYGCGTKVMHNVAGLLGVMDGAASDLRTGLPRQMIEIHEAMRLLIVVEHRLDVLTAIYQRQPPLQELIGNGWVQLAAKDPDSPAIHRFVPGKGWVPWDGAGTTLPKVMYSSDWVRGQREPLPPALIEMAVEQGA
jgi:uncharacterized protein YbcC (UPF0753/DUF2309 family)